MSVTLADLKTRALEKADMVSSSFVTPTELRGYINASGAELHGILTLRFEDQFVSPTPTQFTLTGSSNVQSLASDFYKLRGVDRMSGADWVPVRSFQWEERGAWNRSSSVVDGRGVRCRVVGSSLYLVPESAAAGTYRYWYCPRWTDLTSDSDVLPDGMTQGRWDEYIAVDVAIKCLMKEDTDVSALMVQKRALLERVEREASNRDASEQERIVDVHSDDWSDLW